MNQFLSAVSFWQEMAGPERTVFCSYLAVICVSFVCILAFAFVLIKLSGRKFIKSCKTIGNFCNESGDINDANLEQFEATCMNEKTDRTFLEGWESFKNIRFGYPSEFINVNKVKEKYSSKKTKIAIIITACVIFLFAVFFAIYGVVVVGAKDGTEIAPMVIELIFPILLLAFLFIKPEKNVYLEFDKMLEDLDTAVKLQRYVNRQIDNTRLFEIENKIKEVIIAELSKPIPSKKEQAERQKILKEMKAEAEAQKAEQANAVEDVAEDLLEEPAEDTTEGESTENKYSESELDDVRDELFGDDVASNVEEDNKSGEVAEEEPVYEAPKKKVIPFRPFVTVLNEALDKEYPTSTMRKLANILVLAFSKFEEKEQRDELKDCIRKFIKNYKAAVEREKAEAENIEEPIEEVATDETEVPTEEPLTQEEPVDAYAQYVEPVQNAEVYGEWQQTTED